MKNKPDHWAFDTVFYHIYPLGFCGAPARNDFTSQPVDLLQKVSEWLPHIRQLGANALYLGPLFESTAHGYDTADYFLVDRRLGDRAALVKLSDAVHRHGMRLILDGVFNHVGRNFWAFRDVQQNGESSPYCSWFDGLHFGERSPYGDPFTYQSWNGHYHLVRLNLSNPDVRAHLFEAVRMWIEDLKIDGLRLDAADCLSFDFMQSLRSFTNQIRPDFWLLGEVVHGDYRSWVNSTTLDSVTNYEAYKGLYSSLANNNYYEIAYTLNRQFGPDGLYTGLPLYNFVDNHDVDRVASNLNNPFYLYPLYLLLFCMPGVPSIYYGSEWGLQAKRTAHSDAALRPNLNLNEMLRSSAHANLSAAISKMATLRAEHAALRYGDYRQLHVAHQSLAFSRWTEQEYLVVMLNSSSEPVRIEINIAGDYTRAIDLLSHGDEFHIQENRLVVDPVHPGWGRMLKIE